MHRRTLYDDRRGVGEPINETGLDGKGLIIRGTHYLLFDTIEQSTVDQRVLGEALMLRPELLFVEDSGSPSDFMDKYFTNVSISYCTPYYRVQVHKVIITCMYMLI